jgi:hypothetical protein
MEDNELATLVAALHLSDLAELNRSSKGKGREGEASAEDAAFAVYKAELKEVEQVEADRRFALSLETAVREDRDALAAFGEQEEIARRDREFALALERGRPLPHSTATSTRFASPQSSRATSLTRATTPASSLFSTASPAPSPSTSKLAYVDCVICGDRTRDAVQVPCADRHHYCRECITSLFNTAAKDESLYPPRCDGTVIPLSLVERLLSLKDLAHFRRKADEFETPNKLYCSTPACSAFLGSSDGGKAGIACGSCQASTCRACKAPWHGLFGACAEGADDEVAAALTNEAGFQRCPGCRRVVELDVGCFHMCVPSFLPSSSSTFELILFFLCRTCLCKREFCYLCAADWKNCECPQWDENRLLVAARARVQAEAAARPRNAPYLPQANLVAEAVEALRVNHECSHRRTAYRPGGGQCESCFHHLPSYLLVRLLSSFFSSPSRQAYKLVHTALHHLPIPPLRPLQAQPLLEQCLNLLSSSSSRPVRPLTPPSLSTRTKSLFSVPVSLRVLLCSEG